MKEKLQIPILQTLGRIADENQTEIYVIGGFVRDLLMNRKSKNDIDILIIGSGIEFAERVAEKLNSKISVFKSFGTAMVRHEDIDIEFVGARKESYRTTSRKPIVENGTLIDDQNRRDFTINAMAVGLNKHNFGELVDPFNGLKDIQHQIIRTPLDRTSTFADNPLRNMRDIRFSAQLKFNIDDTA